MLKDFLDKIPYIGLFAGLVNLVPWSILEEVGLPEQWRFSWLMSFNRSILFQKPIVSGIKNLLKIPDLPLVIVVSHFSDADLQIVASELCSKLKQVRPDRLLGLSLQSENLIDFKSAVLIKASGRKNFFEIDARYDKAIKRLDFTFNPANFQKMAKALLNKIDIIIAAHEPLSNIPNSGWQLPDRAGLGAAYLAQIANAVLLPVAVDIQTSEPVGMSADIVGAAKRLVERDRPQVKVVIGEPFTLDKINQAELEMVGQRISDLPAFNQLKVQGEEVIRTIAALLPEGKRGRWKD